MPWPSTFEDILGRVDIAILNVATDRTDMGTNRKRLLDHLTTPIAFLRGVAGVHSNDLMSSTLSLGSENIEERTPGGVHNALCEMVIFHQAISVEVLDSNMMILFSVLFSDLEMEVSALPFDLEMGVCRTLGGFPTSLRAFLPARNRALLASERGLTLAIVAGVLNRVTFAIRQEGLQPYVNPDIRMLTHGWSMLLLGFGLADNERVPVSVSTQDEMSCLRRAFNRTMKLDLDGATQLLRDRKMLAIEVKLKVCFVLPELDTMPPIGLLETGETSLRTLFSHGKEAPESLIQTICQHLNGRSGHMLTPASFEASGQIVFHEEFARLLIVLFGGSQHLIVEMPRLDQAPYEGFGLSFIRIEAIFKRSHAMYFIANEFNCREGMGPYSPTPTRNAALAFSGGGR